VESEQRAGNDSGALWIGESRPHAPFLLYLPNVFRQDSMTTDAQPAAPSAAPESTSFEAVTAADHAVAANDVAAFREAKRAEKLGKPLDVPAASSAAQPEGQAASTDASSDAASEAAKPRKTAEDRIKELLAKEKAATARAEAAERRAAEIEAARTTPKQDERTPDSRPAPAKVEAFPSYDAYLVEHPEASYEEYIDARTEHRFNALKQQETESRERTTRETAHQQAIKTRDTQAGERIQAAVKADPEFWDHVSDEVKSLKPFDAIRDPKTGQWREQPTAKHCVAEELLKSPVMPQLMRHFTDHPEDLAKLYQLQPDALLKAFGKLEARLEKGTETVAATPPKHVTSAPAPPTTLGQKSMQSADPIDAAVAADDVAAFRAAKLQRRIAMTAR
jgi:hypothetical protein